MSDADAATTALIAQLLAEDYKADQLAAAQEDFDDDEDYLSCRKKKRRRKRKPPAKAKPKAAPKQKKLKQSSKAKAKAKAPDADKGGAKKENNNVNKVQDGGGEKKKKVIRLWLPEEEKLFLEAVELFGRNWKSCVAHLNHSRDVKGFKSHAQKYFVKLYRDGKPLPAKVRCLAQL